MSLDSARNLASAAGMQVTPALFSSNPELQALAQAVSSLSSAVVELTDHLRDNK